MLIVGFVIRIGYSFLTGGYDMESLKSESYDSTVSESKEESIAKAINIMLSDIEKKQKIGQSSIIRPEFNFRDFVLPFIIFVFYTAVFVIAIVNSYTLSELLHISDTIAVIGVLILFFIILLILAKPFSLWLILLYQKFAPENIRKQCCFKPCCSEYMKISICKYGLYKGIKKGIGRLSRCHFPNGGVDYP